MAQPQWPLINRWLRRGRAQLVVDIYDPETFETLELMADERPSIRRIYTDLSLDRLHDALRTGHHFMCASEKQRDLWLGAMLSLRLIDPRGYQRDPSLRSVIDTVPFGLPASAPSPIPGVGPRGRLPGVDEHSELVLWNGGLWNWLDPATAVRAVARLAERRPGIRLVFMGAATRAAAAHATRAGAGGSAGAGRGGLAGPLQRELGALRSAGVLVGAGGLRDLDPRRAPGDALRLPHAPARLLLVGSAGGVHGRGRTGRPRAARGSRRRRRAGRRRRRRGGARADPRPGARRVCPGARTRRCGVQMAPRRPCAGPAGSPAERRSVALATLAGRLRSPPPSDCARPPIWAEDGWCSSAAIRAASRRWAEISLSSRDR